MSRPSQRKPWLMQHCYSPYGTTQLEKTGKKGSFGPQKASFGVPEVLGGTRGADLVPTAPDWPVWVGFMVTTHFDLVSGPFHGPIFCGNFFCIAYQPLLFVYHLKTRAGELPRSASSHF